MVCVSYLEIMLPIVWRKKTSRSLKFTSPSFKKDDNITIQKEDSMVDQDIFSLWTRDILEGF